MFRFTILAICVCLLNLTPYINALSPEQKALIHEHFETIGKTCIGDNPISEEDIAHLRAREMATGENVPCMLACIMKTIGVIDANGLFSKETVMNKVKIIFNDDDELKVIEDYFDACAHVNTEAVGDGTKGCERAMLGYKCMLEKKSQFTLDV